MHTHTHTLYVCVCATARKASPLYLSLYMYVCVLLNLSLSLYILYIYILIYIYIRCTNIFVCIISRYVCAKTYTHIHKHTNIYQFFVLYIYIYKGRTKVNPPIYFHRNYQEPQKHCLIEQVFHSTKCYFLHIIATVGNIFKSAMSKCNFSFFLCRPPPSEGESLWRNG